MSWGQSVFQYLPRRISTPEIKQNHEANYRMQYGSGDFYKRKHSHKEFLSSSSMANLRALTEDGFDGNDWKAILSNRNQLDKNRTQGFPTSSNGKSNGKSKYYDPNMKSSAHDDPNLQIPMQTEYIESIKTSFFQLGTCVCNEICL
jgi:hypothetical protein